MFQTALEKRKEDEMTKLNAVQVVSSANKKIKKKPRAFVRGVPQPIAAWGTYGNRSFGVAPPSDDSD